MKKNHGNKDSEFDNDNATEWNGDLYSDKYNESDSDSDNNCDRDSDSDIHIIFGTRHGTSSIW